MKKKRKSPQRISSTGSLVLSPEQTADIQNNVYDVVRKNIPRAAEALKGTRKWSDSQTKLFMGLLNKVMPNIQQSRDVPDPINHNDINEYSAEDLRRIIAEEEARIGQLKRLEQITPIEPDTFINGIPSEAIERAAVKAFQEELLTPPDKR